MKIPRILHPSSGLVNLNCSFICRAISVVCVVDCGRTRFFCHFFLRVYLTDCRAAHRRFLFLHCSGRRPSSICTVACLINHCQSPCMRQTAHRTTQECLCYPDKQSRGAETLFSHPREDHISIAHRTIREGLPLKYNSIPATPYHLRPHLMKNNLSCIQLDTAIVPSHPTHLTIQLSKKRRWLEYPLGSLICAYPSTLTTG